MNTNSLEAYKQLGLSGALSAQKVEILSAFKQGDILSTYTLANKTSIKRLSTIGARCNSLAEEGLLVPVGREKHNGRSYTTYRLVKDKAEQERQLKARSLSSKKKPLDMILEGQYSRSLKRAVELELDRINQTDAA